MNSNRVETAQEKNVITYLKNIFHNLLVCLILIDPMSSYIPQRFPLYQVQFRVNSTALSLVPGPISS